MHEAHANRADAERWDSDPDFWRLDTWSDAQLADNARFNYYLAHASRRAADREKGAKTGASAALPR